MQINNKIYLAAITLTAIMMAACASSEKTKAEPNAAVPVNSSAQTRENLQTAYNGESNANVKYLAYAKKADEEGYAKVASLFRAAARAEEIHKNNHADVIKKMGGTPAADIKTVEVKTTAENLKAAIEGETYERDKMYTDFMNEARNSGNKDALRSFNFAKTAEGEHAKLYSAALNDLNGWKMKATFYVCPSCGYTTPDATLEKCPVDFTPKEKFESIS